MEFELITSKRRTVSIILKNGKIIVRAPLGTTREGALKFIEKHAEWIEKNIPRSIKRENQDNSLSDEQIKSLKRSAMVYLAERTAYYAKIMGLEYGRVRITSAKKRFGSCTSERNISYSYRLMLYPPDAIDYVVVHELAHLVYLDHSKEFYSVIERILPDYKKRRQMLK